MVVVTSNESASIAAATEAKWVAVLEQFRDWLTWEGRPTD